ncbi:outer membrane spanin [Serratia phage Scapp]|uniref:Outer membrane spanin n=1 Tax=Serratia phage Scapp TaxID=2282409 RepID=A0A345L6S4_9CAUD|nr:Rz-like spanin [Serratia phage Scapp]AXH50976.1 outer membrane spanin [Serratia phage Scapp]
MKKQKMMILLTASIAVLSGCASKQPAPVQPPAWVMQPPPNLMQLLDRIITPYDKASPNPPSK